MPVAVLDLTEANAQHNRPEWLAARRAGIGGSEAAAILGLDRFSSPMAVYLDKIGELGDEDDEPNEAMEWGNRLEDAVAGKFQYETGYIVKKPTHMYRHAEHEFMLGNADREVSYPGDEFGAPWPAEDTPPPNGEGILEIKTSRLEEDWEDGPPDRVLIQAIHYLAIYGFQRAWVSVLLHGRNYDCFPIERDEDVVNMLIDAEGEFWQRVVDRNPPPVDGSPSTTEALNRLYAEANLGSICDLPSEAEHLLVELRDYKARAKTVEEQIKQRENALKAIAGEHEVALFNGTQAFTWKAGKKSRLDAEALETDHPDLVARYRTKPPSRRFVLTKEK